MYGDAITMGQAITVCVFSIVLVFLVLLAISYMIDITAYFVRKGEKKQDPKVAAPAKVAAAPAPAATVVDDTTNVVLAAAAIAAYLGCSTDQIVVKSIRKVVNVETSWAQKSRMDSVR